MTVEKLLNKAREDARNKVWPYYLNLCDGNEEEALKWIESERKDGVIDDDIKRWTLNNIREIINAIRKTDLMTNEEKEAAIAEIHKCPEHQERNKKVTRMFANHFVKYKDAYLK